MVYGQSPINRLQLVERHNVTLHQADTLSSLTLGNGNFAFTVDVTGLQTFPDAYSKGVPLGTESVWGWHSFSDTASYRLEESYQHYQLNGRDVTYCVQWHSPERNKKAADWYRQNVHRLQLGNIGFHLLKQNGEPCSLADIQQVDQVLDLWNGIIHSRYKVEGTPVEVWTTVHPDKDIVSLNPLSCLS